MTNKRIALFTLLIGLVAVAGLFITGYMSIEQASVLISPLVIGCIALMGFDAFYDYLNIAFRIGEFAVSLTPSLEDDKRLAEIKATVEQLQSSVDEKAVGGVVLEWLDKNWRLLPDLFIPHGELEKTADTVTTTTTPLTTPLTTPIAGTNVSFYTPDNTDKDNG